MNDELYAASFQDGWFKTGDLGRMAEDGYVTIVGRSKDIVIRGGENIPIIEIENIIRDLPEVKDIVIVGVPDKRLGERSEEHTSELQSLMRISYAVFCLKKQKTQP